MPTGSKEKKSSLLRGFNFKHMAWGVLASACAYLLLYLVAPLILSPLSLLIAAGVGAAGLAYIGYKKIGSMFKSTHSAHKDSEKKPSDEEPSSKNPFASRRPSVDLPASPKSKKSPLSRSAHALSALWRVGRKPVKPEGDRKDNPFKP